jgi:hypothetical protein
MTRTESSGFNVAGISASTKQIPSLPLELPAASPGPKRKRRKSVKGFDGEIDIDLNLLTAPDSVMDGRSFSTLHSVPVLKL